MLTQASDWISAIDFAAITHISRQAGNMALRQCVDGVTWRGHRLVVRRVRGQGGKAGWQYQVRLDSLPAEMREAWQANPVAIRADDPAILEIDDNGDVARWRKEVIEEALKHPSMSSERAAEIARAAAVVRTWPSSRRGRVKAKTIRTWIHRYEQSGMAGLKPRRRADRGERRVFITRAWDGAVPFDDATKERIRDATDRDVASLWASNKLKVVGWSWVERLASEHLEEATKRAGFDPGPERLKAVCRLSRSFVDRRRNYRRVANYAGDRKRWFDKDMPRILRTRAGREPMEIVIGDVHHMDVQMRRPDGRTFTPKIIAWQDWATNQIFAYPIFLKKGGAVRREHVIEAYIAMVMDPLWGVPGFLYLDNGSEYSCWAELIDDAQKLNTDVRDLASDPALAKSIRARRSSIVKARPYNAPAKAIEGLFGVLEGGVFSMLPGWIGGNRMDKKTANVDKAPPTYPGDEQAFRRDLALMIEAYETNPQSGALRGRSPRQAFADAVAAGWERRPIDPDALRATFARTEIRTVAQGGFSYKGTRYTAREIQRLPAGTKVCVRVPLFGDMDRLPVLTLEEKLIGYAERDRPYDALDPAGAIEAEARVSEHKRALAEMRRNVDPVDVRERVRRLVAKEAPAPVPADAPVIHWDDGTLERIGREMAVPAAEREATRQDAYEREQEEFARNVDRLNALAKRASG